MKATRLFLSMTTLALVAGWASNADAILVDFDSTLAGTDLQGVNVSGVTLSTAVGTEVIIVHNVSDSLGYGSQSGDQAIGHGVAPDGFPQPNPLIGIFDAPVSSITFWGGDNPTIFSDIDIWTLRIFSDAAGTTEIGSGVTATDATTGLGYSSITRLFPAGILRFEASSSTGVGFDTLSFTPVPEPGAIGFGIIASIGLVVGGFFRSKKEK